MGKRILLVDDEARLVRLVRGYLEQDGYEVAAAGDGRAALLVSREFDVPAYPLGRRTAVCLPEDVSDTSFRIGFDHVLRDRAAIAMN